MGGHDTYIERQPVAEAQLESAIDVVAREMTAFEPSGDLRARVIEQIEHGPHRRSPVARWAWAGATAVILMALATAVWIARPVQAPGGSEATVAEQRAAAPQVTPAVRPPQPVETSVPSVAQPAPASRGTRPRPIQAVGAGASEVAEETSLVPALAEIQPLSFPAVEPDLLHVAAVEVAPIPAMPEIDIPSVNPGPNDSQSVDLKKEKQQ